MNRSPLPTGSRSDPPREYGGSARRIESNDVMATAVLCFAAAILLLLLRGLPAFHAFMGQLGSFLASVADYLWDWRTALIVLALLSLVMGFSYHSRSRIIPLFIKCSLLFLFFIYSILPLRWAQIGLIRSPESYPSTTPFDAILMLLLSLGTLFYG